MANNKKERPKNELLYTPTTSERRGTPMAILQVMMFPTVICVALSMLVNGTAGLIGLIASSIGFYWWYKRGPMAGDARLLRVENKRLIIARPNGNQLNDVALSDVLNVELDTKTVEMVQEGGSAIPAVRMIESKVGPAIDKSRLVIALADKKQIRLGEEFQANMDATEWTGKIRVFLRKNGWVPNDERSPDSRAPESEEEPTSEPAPSSSGRARARSP
jgi:hypothetical protein